MNPEELAYLHSLFPTREEMRDAVEGAAPDCIREMGDTPPAGMNLDRVALGYFGSQAVWREFPMLAANVSLKEWSSQPSGTNVVVIIEDGRWATTALSKPTSDTISLAAVATDAERWVYAKCDLSATAITLELTEDANKAADDPENMIVVKNLSKWKRTAAGLSLIQVGHDGEIHIPAVFGPPLGGE